jgi:hypothetical protein
MQELSFYRFIYFGTCLRYLQDANSSFNLHTKGGVVDNIKTFLARLESFELHVTKRASRDLGELLEKLEDEKSLVKLTPELAKDIRDAMHKIRHTLDAEAAGKRVFVVSDKRYPIENLLNDPGSLFAKDVYKTLPQLAKSDFSEAAQCIAFMRPTAAAFHALRGTESMLREYYCRRVKRKRVALAWGPIVDALRKRKNIPVALLNQLDHIRHGFRNPTAHPEKTYDIDETQDLFSLCIDVVNRMSQDLAGAP